MNVLLKLNFSNLLYNIIRKFELQSDMLGTFRERHQEILNVVITGLSFMLIQLAAAIVYQISRFLKFSELIKVQFASELSISQQLCTHRRDKRHLWMTRHYNLFFESARNFG